MILEFVQSTFQKSEICYFQFNFFFVSLTNILETSVSMTLNKIEYTT
jgi:hypothetical protein